jgi:predicted ATPase
MAAGAGRATLLERDRELEQLRSWLHEARAGHGRLVLVGGETGVGKTTLVDHLRSRVPPAVRQLAGACDPLATSRPLDPLVDVVGPSWCSRTCTRPTARPWLPNVEPFVLPDANHLLHVRNPRGMAERLASFFAEHPGPA